MSMVFPGMDPYLEDPTVWPGVHSRLVVYLADALQARLGSRYIVAVEERVYIEDPQRDIIPDVWIKRGRPSEGGSVAVLEAEDEAPVVEQVPELEVHESYIALLDRTSGQRIVTVIEVISPSNKYAGPGRESYLAKRRDVLSSPTHLVEIDLLHAGPHVVAIPEWIARRHGDYHSLVCINRARGLRDVFELYPRGLRKHLPRVRVPLADDDPHVPLDLQAVLAQTYDAGRYRDRLPYDAPCRPPLAPADQSWADELLRAAGVTPPQAGAT